MRHVCVHVISAISACWMSLNIELGTEQQKNVRIKRKPKKKKRRKVLVLGRWFVCLLLFFCAVAHLYLLRKWRECACVCQCDVCGLQCVIFGSVAVDVVVS